MTVQKRNLFVQLFDCINIPFSCVYSYFLQVKRTIQNNIVLFMHYQLFWERNMSLLPEITIKKNRAPAKIL